VWTALSSSTGGVSSDYDPMFAKVIVWPRTASALSNPPSKRRWWQTAVVGVTTSTS
jgi:acetyl/propionyl-CoA carboxylase alpha subunit